MILFQIKLTRNSGLVERVGMLGAQPAALIAQRNLDNPLATFSVDALKASQHAGACYHAPPPIELAAAAVRAPFSFTEAELSKASASPKIDWRAHGAVGPIQQQHPYGTCWAFSMTAVTEAISVIQGKNAFQKLSEQMTISCVEATACGDNADVLWESVLSTTGGKYQTEEAYPYNRTCNFFREQQLAPDGTNDGYPGICNSPASPPYGPCPPCPGVARKDGTPACNIDASKGFSNAAVQGWGFVSPHGVDGGVLGALASDEPLAPMDVTRMVAALLKYGPAQIGACAGEGVRGTQQPAVFCISHRSLSHLSLSLSLSLRLPSFPAQASTRVALRGTLEASSRTARHAMSTTPSRSSALIRIQYRELITGSFGTHGTPRSGRRVISKCRETPSKWGSLAATLVATRRTVPLNLVRRVSRRFKTRVHASRLVPSVHILLSFPLYLLAFCVRHLLATTLLLKTITHRRPPPRLGLARPRRRAGGTTTSRPSQRTRRTYRRSRHRCGAAMRRGGHGLGPRR